jgi:hypothetical protein
MSKTHMRLKLIYSAEQCTEFDSIVECLIGFVAETTIQSIKRATDDTIANWYHAVSPSPSVSVPLYDKLMPPSLALQNLRQELALRLGPLPPTQTPPQTGQPGQIAPRLARHDARRAS